jgi:hypothetical protein
MKGKVMSDVKKTTAKKPVAKQAPQTVEIPWWNRPMTWGIAGGLVLLLLLGFAFGPDASDAEPLQPMQEPAVLAPIVEDVQPTNVEPSPLVSPSADSGDNSVNVNGDSNTINYNAAPPVPTSVERVIETHEVETVIYQPIERTVVVREPIHERPMIEQPRDATSHNRTYHASDDCLRRRRNYETTVASWYAGM